jgi:aspartate carbamoyltransferase catalytic subunit
MHIIKTQNFNRKFLENIFESALEMRRLKGSPDISHLLDGKIIATLFYEESTRTRLSFESAAIKLGASILSTANAKQFSSVSKGEILEDTIKTISKYADCIVLRYYEEGGAAIAAHVSSVPIINAGDGAGQHPTQALLDLFTINDELGQIDGLSVALVGDLLHGRTIHSLVYLLGKFESMRIYLISPSNLCLPKDILQYLQRHNVDIRESNDFKDVDKFDVLYQTRIQKERFGSQIEYEESKGKLIVTRDLANQMKSNAIILHPLPRVDEIRYGVDDNHRAKYFKQVENGLYVRMALLKILLTK